MGNLFDSEESYIAALRINSENMKKAAVTQQLSPKGLSMVTKQPTLKNKNKAKGSTKKLVSNTTTSASPAIPQIDSEL